MRPPIGEFDLWPRGVGGEGVEGSLQESVIHLEDDDVKKEEEEEEEEIGHQTNQKKYRRLLFKWSDWKS